MESLSLKEENLIKYIRNIFRLKNKELNYTAIKDIRNPFRQKKKETKAIKDRTLRDIKNLFEDEEEKEDYYKPVRVNNFWSNNRKKKTEKKLEPHKKVCENKNFTNVIMPSEDIKMLEFNQY